MVSLYETKQDERDKWELQELPYEQPIDPWNAPKREKIKIKWRDEFKKKRSRSAAYGGDALPRKKKKKKKAIIIRSDNEKKKFFIKKKKNKTSTLPVIG